MKKNSNLGAYLFGLVFFLCGAGFFYGFVGKNLVAAIQMQTWSSTTAQLNSATISSRQKRNDNGGYTTMYKVKASYTYQIYNRSYTGNRPTISGMSSSDREKHEKLLNKIRSEQRANNAITIWYDPNKHSESIYDRSLNLRHLLMMTAFTSVFMLIGGGIIVYVFLSRHDDEVPVLADPNKPWTTRKKWASATIYSEAQSDVKLAWFSVAIATCFFGTFSLALFGRNTILTIVSVLLLIIPALVIKYAVRVQREWKRFRTVPLILEPYPGVIGGNVGGQVVIPAGLMDGDIYTLKLKCTKHWKTHSGGKSRSNQAIVWSDEKMVEPATHLDGTVINFLFKVPAGTPSSSKPDDSYHEWKLNIEGKIKGVDFNRDYEIPVFETEDSQSVAEELEENPLSMTQQLEMEQRLSVDRLGDTISLVTPVSKDGKIFAFIGAIFPAAGIAIAISENVFFGTFFALFGSLFFLLGLWIWGRNCKIEISPNKFEMNVFWFNFPVNHHLLSANDVKDISAYTSSSSQSGKELQEKYGLHLTTNLNKTLDLGGEFISKKNAEHMKLEIEKVLNL